MASGAPALAPGPGPVSLSGAQAGWQGPCWRVPFPAGLLSSDTLFSSHERGSLRGGQEQKGEQPPPRTLVLGNLGSKGTPSAAGKARLCAPLADGPASPGAGSPVFSWIFGRTLCRFRSCGHSWQSPGVSSSFLSCKCFEFCSPWSSRGNPHLQPPVPLPWQPPFPLKSGMPPS